MKTFLSIALSGLSEADAKQVISALDSPKLGKWSLSEGSSSDLLIIDVDSVWGHMDWLRAVAEDRRCVAYTEQPAMRDCDLLLQKPLKVDKLIDMLLAVESGTTPAPARTAPPEKKTAPAAKAPAPAPAPKPVAAAPEEKAQPKPAPEPVKPAAAPAAATASPAPRAAAAPAAPKSAVAAGTVGSMLLDGVLSDTVLVKSESGDVQLAIDPGKSIYRAPPQLKPIEKLLSIPSDRAQSVKSDDTAVQHAGPEQPIVRLLWFAALCASNGKLAPHLDPGATWRLTRWPQIEREFPRHFRIATAMMKQPGTLEEVAEASKSPTADVAAFINAYYVAGYVAPEGSNETDEAPNSTSGVLLRLRRSFSRNAREASA